MLRRLLLRYSLPIRPPQCGGRPSKATLLACCLSIGLIIAILQVAFHQDLRVVLAVVEEHHEVLPYWFEAADSGVIPKSGITLIHIDGHSDEDIPDYIPGMPFFRYPKEEEEIEVLMQSNDVFIQGAVMSGLISRVIWIWPSWDKQEKHMDMERNINLGHAIIRYHSVREPHFCNCHIEDQRTKELSCHYNSFKDPRGKDPEVPLMPKKCKLSTMYNSVHLNEQVALEKLSKGKLLRPGEPVILDIDQDFFGCESGVDVLTKSGVQWRLAQLINTKLKQLFCPHSIKHETAGDQMMKQCIAIIIKECHWDAEKQICESPFDEIMAKTMDQVMLSFQSVPSLFCGRNDGDLRTVWKELVILLHRRSLRQLQALADLGFCLNTSPATFGFEEEEEGEILLCHGRNTPNNTLVYLHTPTEREVTHRMHILSDLIHHIRSKAPPQLVTLSRSVRDGYTPRNISSILEEGIIKAIQTRDQTLERDFRIVYDKNLLGGSQGWKGRYKMDVTP